MAAAGGQPMVAVKKADGTVVRITLAEFNELKKKVTVAPQPPATPALPLASDGRAADVETIMKQVGTMVGPDNQNRLRSVLQLYLKDIRTRTDTENALVRKIGEGGLGLSVDQKNEVLRQADTTKHVITPASAVTFKITEKKTTVPDLEIDQPTTVFQKNREPAIVQHTFPATQTPFNAFKHEAVKKVSAASVVPSMPVAPIAATPAPAKKMPSKEFSALLAAATSSPLEIHDLIKPKNQSPRDELVSPMAMPIRPAAPTSPLSLSGTPEAKPLVRDVAAVSLEVGPIEELQQFSLTDFRRLSNNPIEAAHELHEKFKHIQEESIVLYLRAIETWKNSPLYLAYIEAVTQGLSEHRPLSAVLSDKKRIQVAEIEALVAMEKELL